MKKEILIIILISILILVLKVDISSNVHKVSNSNTYSTYKFKN